MCGGVQMRVSVIVCCGAMIIGVIAAVSGPQSASAQGLKHVVRTLNNVLNPEDAHRYEERARHNHRPDEERYWHEYGAGLEEQRREHGIGQDEARRYEEQARRNHHAEEEHYWRDYRTGLGEHGPR